jgi:hypothetical protein
MRVVSTLSFALFSGLCLVADPIIGARRHGECARLVSTALQGCG